jgi:hypothetical protein
MPRYCRPPTATKDLYDHPEDPVPPTLIHNLFTFSNETRQCIGIHLDYQNIRLFVTGINRRCDLHDATLKQQNGPSLELYSTSYDDDIAMFGELSRLRCARVVKGWG